jgi:hypothetical protein
MSPCVSSRGGLTRAIALLIGGLLVVACEAGGPGEPHIMPGPTVPSPLPTVSVSPFVWDTRAELEIWTTNRVSRGPLTIEGLGADAFIRIVPASADWVLRGPDYEPPAPAIRTVKVRYRWTPDPSLQPGAKKTGHLIAVFDRSPLAADQPAAHAELPPSSEWAELALTPGSFRDPLDVRYVYFLPGAWNRGVFEIDRIQLVDQAVTSLDFCCQSSDSHLIRSRLERKER